jgi:hypothetical protein
MESDFNLETRKLTKRESLKLCEKMWKLIATPTLADKWESKSGAAQKIAKKYGFGTPLHNCFSCQYVLDHYMDVPDNCEYCPMKKAWGKDNNGEYGENDCYCQSSGTIYDLWRNSNDVFLRRKCAKQIADEAHRLLKAELAKG